jgi:hypothetical protein
MTYFKSKTGDKSPKCRGKHFLDGRTKGRRTTYLVCTRNTPKELLSRCETDEEKILNELLSAY